MKLPAFLFATLALAVCASAQAPAAANPGEAEAAKCEERIAAVQREVLSRYEDALLQVQLTLQKAADLEGALAVRAERQRLSQERALTDKAIVPEPKALRTLQTDTLAKMQELISALIGETVPKLVEYKKGLTVAGKLDEAVAVRAAIERLQNAHLPIARADAGSVVAAETLLQTYAADRSRADRTYKSQRIVVRGVLGAYRQDANDSKNFHLYLTGAGSTGWIQCAIPLSEFRFREEKQFNTIYLVISSKDDSIGTRMQKGQTIDVRGVCEGWEDLVKMGRCDFGK